jgi:hypothetical protein
MRKVMAFPYKGPALSCDEPGMTLRDFFASQVLPTVAAKYLEDDMDEDIALIAYNIADAMMERRNKS